ncbi:MAG: peptidoglycan DD-metalloendopeptidase family protein [Myxococcales bacterium]|nr:peptidoglycan DD-metalloendopeptidase family protein [Myxococcales bacterium]
MKHTYVLLALLAFSCADYPTDDAASGEGIDPSGHAHDDHAHDDHAQERRFVGFDPAPETGRYGQTQSAVTCSASMTRYPVAGAHNGGWDSNALTYTCPAHPTSSKDNSDFIAGEHYGNDIFAAKGTPLVACVAGTLIEKATTTIGGNVVTIKDACGWYYYYAHMNTFAAGLAVGQTVKAGDPLGTVGNTGNASGTSPHLHFSVYPGTYTAGIDPFPLLQSVDSGSCSGGGGTPDGVNPNTPNMSIKVTTNAVDTLTAGPSSGIADVLEGQEWSVDVLVTNAAGGKNTPDYVRVGYLVESPWLEVVTWTIHSDWPAKDKKTWVVNDSDGAPDNPSKASPPATGQMNLYAMAAGETKRIRYTVRAKQYSLGAADHPDLRAWIWHVGSYYGEMTGWDDPVETNLAGSLLRSYAQHDVYGATHWEWEGAYAETEGWTAGNAIKEVAVNTVAHALAIEASGDDPYVYSPTVSLPAATWKGFEFDLRQYQGVKTSRLYFLTAADGSWTEAKSVAFDAPGDGQFHKFTVNMAQNPSWTGTVTRLRLDPVASPSGWYDLASLRAVKDVPVVDPDGDGDGYVKSKDCNDSDAGIKPGAAELCDAIDNDCDGSVDEGLQTGVEACNGKDDDCDQVVPANEADADSDGVRLCAGDCDDGDASFFPGAGELCDDEDNDCDGQTDEGFDVGAICTKGLGQCQVVGSVSCDATGAVTCDALPSAATPESCDGKDNDCDGQIDEDFGLGVPCTATGASCKRAGISKCTATGQIICDAAPAQPLPEHCNGDDDDCDGLIDEDFVLGTPCEAGVGACATAGVTGCTLAGLVCLSVPAPPSAETCNGVDDDCDGQTDDGFPVGSACQVTGPGCVGDGTWACTPSGGTACDAECLPISNPADEGGDEPGDGDGGGDSGDTTAGNTDTGDASDSDVSSGDGGGLLAPGSGDDVDVSFTDGVTRDDAGGCSTPAPTEPSRALPWTLLLPLALMAVFRRQRARDRPAR